MNPLHRAAAALLFALVPTSIAAADPPAPQPPLAGTSWVAEEVVGDRMTHHVPPTLQFGDDGTVNGVTQCSSYSGRYDNYGRRGLNVRALIYPRQACADGEAQVRFNRYIHALDDVSRYEMTSDGALILRTPVSGSIRFRRAE